jgi:hypothetical protein
MMAVFCHDRYGMQHHAQQHTPIRPEPALTVVHTHVTYNVKGFLKV